MKILFMGTPDFALFSLRALVDAGENVAAVVTQTDKPKGRGMTLSPPPVKVYATERGIPVYQPKTLKDGAFETELREIDPDIIIVVAYGKILPKYVLDYPKYGCINIHASLLPKYRGAAPIQWAVINGDEVSGVTTMQMDVGLDTGDILDTVEVRLDPKETGGSLFDRLSLAGGKLILSTLEKAEAGILHPVKQDEAEATHVTMLDKSMGQIDWSMDAAVIERLIRGLNPWPSAYTKFEGKTLKIWSADVEEDAAGRPSPETFGQVVCVGKDAFSVQTGKGLLTIRELQLEGKKRMDTAAFLRGYPVETGVKLG
mgnify:CR=1 FL=1